MKRHHNLVSSILIAFIFSLGLMTYQNMNKQDIEIKDAWKASINQGYEFYLKSLLKHLQLNIDRSANENVSNMEHQTQNLPIMILPIK